MKTSATFSAVCILFFLFLNSCTKSDPEELGASYSRVRLYDDTLPDPRNHSIRIAAGNGRLLMTYGNFFERFFMVNGAAIEPPPPKNAWMLTDNEGNLIKRGTFPSGLAMGDILAMPDNSFLIVTSIGDFSSQGSYGGVQLMRLDPNGVLSSVDTLDLPVSDPVMILATVHLSLSQNGNALLYFGYSSQGGFGGSFIGEMTVQGDFLWHKEFMDYTITDCVSDPNGGYLITGKIFYLMTYTSTVFIMNTNATADSLWFREIVCVDAGNGLDNGIGQIVSSGDGNYRLSYADWAANYSRQNTEVVTFNQEGEFLDTTVVALGASVAIQKDSKGLFLLYGIDAVYGSVTDQFNSSYAILDAEMNLTTKSQFQNLTTDMMNAACRTSDGKIACFGIIQSYGKRYYIPQLILFN